MMHRISMIIILWWCAQIMLVVVDYLRHEPQYMCRQSPNNESLIIILHVVIIVSMQSEVFSTPKYLPC